MAASQELRRLDAGSVLEVRPLNRMFARLSVTSERSERGQVVDLNNSKDRVAVKCGGEQGMDRRRWGTEEQGGYCSCRPSTCAACLVAHSGLTFCSVPGSSVHGASPGKNTVVGCHSLFQGIFPTQESNSALPHCRRILHRLSPQRIPRILVWVASPFSR